MRRVDQTHYDVAIIGGGPVGLGLGIDLAQRGINVCIIEKYTTPQRIPKGQNLTQRSGEHLRTWGVSAAIRAATPIPPDYGNEGLVAYGSLLSGFHYDWFKRGSVREYYAADNERLPQYETERILRERSAEYANLNLLTGWTYKVHREQADTVETTLTATESELSQNVTSTYLVGCDGTRSTVRETSRFTQTHNSHSRRMVLLVFRSTQLNDILESRFPGKTIFNALNPDMQGYWQFLGRVDLNSNWFFHAPVPDDATLENHDFNAVLNRAIGTEVNAEFDYIGFWDLRFSHADTYRKGRVFIAGDAAHSHPPYGGYGINTGFEDARNLSWKLAAVFQGWGTDSLLDTYTEERHPVFASTRDDFIARMINNDAQFTKRYNPSTNPTTFETAWSKRASGGQAEVSQFVPHYAGSSIVSGKPGATSGAKGVHEHKATAGYHLSPQLLDDGSTVYDQMNHGFTLLVLAEPDDATQFLVSAFETAASEMHIPLRTVVSRPTTGTDLWESDVILIRPDHYVAAATTNTPDLKPHSLLSLIIGR